MSEYFEIKQGIRTFTIKLGELGRSDSSKFYARLNLFGYKGSNKEAWERYKDLSTSYNRKAKKKK